MAKTGLAGQLGYVQESAYGTRTVPTRFNEFLSESLQLQIERMESQGLRAGRRVTRNWAANKKGISGAINFEVANKGFGLILEHILGTIATTTPGGGTTSKTHTGTLGDLDGSSLTIQVGRPDLSGTVRPFDYLGCKVASAEWSNSVDGFLQLALNIDGQDESTAQTLATASYASSLEILSYVGGTITVGGTQTDVKDFSCSIDNGLKTDRYYIRSNTLKKEQIEDTSVDGRAITGSYSCDFSSLTEYNRFTAGTEAAIVATWSTATFIEAAIPYSLSISLPRVRFDGETPVVAGPDVLNQPVPFKVLQPTDGSSAITVAYTTSDTTP